MPFGIFGTIWAYLKLRDTAPHGELEHDWWGNITFALGLIAILVGITYGIQPYKNHVMGWSSPQVLAELLGGLALLAAFVVIESKRKSPMFNLKLFNIRAFSAGNIAGLLSAIGRGGLQFMLIIWLQGIWLPLHGYAFESTPLWAGIYMLPLTAGFLLMGPLSGRLSDKYGAKYFATGGMVLGALSFGLLMLLHANFTYWIFAVLLFLNGLGSGLFAAPNTTAIMNAVPADQRGQASGMRATFMNSGQVLSIGLFFSLMILGLAHTLPQAMQSSLTAQGVSTAVAAQVARGIVLADAAYGINTGFRDGLTELGLQYVVGVQSSVTVWEPGKQPLPAKPRGRMGRPPRLLQRSTDHQPVSVKQLAINLPSSAFRELTWREGTERKLRSRFAAIRVRPAHRDYWKAEPHAAEWLLIEWPRGETEPSKYWISTLPSATKLKALVKMAKHRWIIERDYEELKQELGLGHFEGRNWRGFHHHATLCIAAYGFLVAERNRFSPSARAGNTGFVAPGPASDFRPRGSPRTPRAA